MNVGDTLAWELPDEPEWGTVVEPARRGIAGLKWERNALIHADAGGWTAFTYDDQPGRSVTRWTFILYYAKGHLRDVNCPHVTFSWKLPPEPPIGSVVTTRSGVRYEKRVGRYQPNGEWCVQDANSYYARDPLLNSIADWPTFLYRAGGSVTVARVGV